MKIRVGMGYDVHPFAPDDSPRRLVLGGVRFDDVVGLAGHSDADAVAHAVADAILSPAGLPDLGTLFPASDEQHAGADSLGLLRECAQLVAAERWYVGNVDVVINAERPRLAPHMAAMAANVAAALEPAAEPMSGGVYVSVQPKRGEGVGFVGRGEGIAVWAVALLQH